MLTRYFIELSFNGTNYHGWQIQKNALSVQSVINETLSTILSENIMTVGAGRTDTGVHARYFIAHFDTQKNDLDKNTKLIYRLNRYLPDDIAIKKIIRVKNSSHARFDALNRTYQYFISKVKDPFNKEYSFYFNNSLDVKLMNRGAQILMKYKDFKSFSKLHSDVKTTICSIHRSKWKEEKNKIIFSITADRFLRNMVRAIVGTLIDLGLKKITINDFKNIIESKERSNAGLSVPSAGLFLIKIDYPKNLFP